MKHIIAAVAALATLAAGVCIVKFFVDRNNREVEKGHGF